MELPQSRHVNCWCTAEADKDKVVDEDVDPGIEADIGGLVEVDREKVDVVTEGGEVEEEEEVVVVVVNVVNEREEEEEEEEVGIDVATEMEAEVESDVDTEVEVVSVGSAEADRKAADGANLTAGMACLFTGYDPLARNPPRWFSLNASSQSCFIKPVV